VATDATNALVSEALDNLVNQFARPLDCLRELVQNSLDAGTPRVEVAIGFTPEPDDPTRGVLSIHVDDFGEGMDEAIIDGQLTRLFSSTKEGDLTRIGKFGIGFTSIFALRPLAVLLHTGRHGEYWELLFHPDRSYDKVRVDQPVSGTRVTIYRRERASRVADFVRQARDVLAYWCEHSTRPITFEDRTGGVSIDGSADPFAGFAASASAEPISRPLDLPGCALVHEHREQGLELLIGAGAAPSFGFYNGGLTLVRSTDPGMLGPYADRLGHLSFKVRCDQLEHTLTRDSVRVDATWHRVLQTLVARAEELSLALIAQTAKVAADPGDLATHHGILAATARAWPERGHRVQRAIREARILQSHDGPISPADLEQQEWRAGGLLLHPGDGPLADAMDAAGWRMARASPETERLLAALARPLLHRLLAQAPRRIVRAADRFVLPHVVDDDALRPQERDLLERVRAHLSRATQGTATLQLGNFVGHDHARDLILEAPGDGRLFERSQGGLWTTLWRLFDRRRILLNRQHDHIGVALSTAWTDPDAAALGLAHAILHAEGRADPAHLDRLLGDP